MKYRQVMAVQRGGPEMLHVVEQELRPPRAGEVRVRVLAVPVCLPDVQARYGLSPSAPRLPFVPGYAVVGVVDSIGPAVRSTFAVGDLVAALTIVGGYAEYIYLRAQQLMAVPSGLDLAQAAVLILNSIVAYQCLHRVARVQRGDAVLVIGASGGVGTAFLQLGQLAGLKMYGLASAAKHSVLQQYGAHPIDYRSQDFVAVLREVAPGGVQVVFDGMGGDYVRRGLMVLKPGGVLVEYGNPLSVGRLLRLLGRVLACNLSLNGKRVLLYGTSASLFGRKPFLEDWQILYRLLAEGKISPLIERRYPLLEAAQANAHLESGQVMGNLALVAPELL